jgi:hypothetical protein
MQLFKMRYLLSNSFLLLLLGCSSAYKDLLPAKGNVGVLQKFVPAFSVALYSTTVDVLDNHLSGLLLIKKMPDSSTRMVFSNETGFTFFDFEFAANGNFKVYSIIKQMDKKAVIKTLRHDFELVLMQHLDKKHLQIQSKNGLVYYTFPQDKGYYHYITDSAGNVLVRMERASKRKKVATAIMKEYTNGIPGTIGIEHSKFNFIIGLKKIER